MTRIHTLFTILLIAIVLFPAFALANHPEESTIIRNSVSVSASSGGNSAEPGQIIVGETSADVFVETIVNGEVVESIDEHYENLDGAIEVGTASEGDGYSVETQIQVGGDNASGEESENITTATTDNLTTYEGVRLEESQKATTAVSAAAIEVINENVERSSMTEEKQQEKADEKKKSSFFTFFSKIFNYVFNLFTR